MQSQEQHCDETQQQQLQHYINSRQQQKINNSNTDSDDGITTLQHTHDLRHKRYERMRTKAVTIAPTNAAVRSAEVLLNNKNFTIVKNENKHCTIAVAKNTKIAEDQLCDDSELAHKNAFLQHNLRVEPARNVTPNLHTLQQQTVEDKFIGFKPKCAYRERNNNVQNSQIFEIHNKFEKHCADDTKIFVKKRLGFKFDNFLRNVYTEDNYSEINGINNDVQSNINVDEADFRHATQFVATDLVEHTVNSNSMEQFFLTSGADSDCSNLEKQLAVAVSGCDNSRHEENSNHFTSSAAAITNASAVHERVTASADVHSVLTDYVLKNDDSADMLISNCNTALVAHNDSDTVGGSCVLDANAKRQNSLGKTVTLYDSQLQLTNNTHVDAAVYDHGELLHNTVMCNQETDYTPIAERNTHVVVDETHVIVHSALDTADTQKLVELTSGGKDVRVDYKLLPKYLLHVESKQTVSENQQQQQQRLAAPQLMLKTNAENVCDALYNVLNDGVVAKHVQKFECISGFDDALTQEIVQPLRSRKLNEHEDSNAAARVRR